MSAVRNRVARLEQVRGGDHPRFLVVHGASNRDEAMAVLREKGVAVGSKDLVDWEPGIAPPTFEIIPMSMPIEDALAILDAEDTAAGRLNSIKGNHDASAQ